MQTLDKYSLVRKTDVEEFLYNVMLLYVGGTDVRDLDPQWYRSHIGIVSQEPILFACSIQDNIAFGKEGATQEEVHETNHLDDTHYPPPVLLRWKPQPVKLMLTTLSHHLRYSSYKAHSHLIVCLLVVLTGRI